MKPMSIPSKADPMFVIAYGMKKGVIFLYPFSIRFWTPSENTVRPPIPVPTSTPARALSICQREYVYQLEPSLLSSIASKTKSNLLGLVNILKLANETTINTVRTKLHWCAKGQFNLFGEVTIMQGNHQMKQQVFAMLMCYYSYAKPFFNWSAPLVQFNQLQTYHPEPN